MVNRLSAADCRERICRQQRANDRLQRADDYSWIRRDFKFVASNVGAAYDARAGFSKPKQFWRFTKPRRLSRRRRLEKHRVRTLLEARVNRGAASSWSSHESRRKR